MFDHVIFIAAAVSGVLAALFAIPFETLKTQIQLENELKYVPKRQVDGAVSTLKFLVRSKGIKRVFRGTTPILFASTITFSLRLFAFNYAHSRNMLSNEQGTILHRAAVFSGITSMASQIICNPCYLVKTRLEYHTIYGQNAWGESTIRNVVQYIHSKYGLKGFLIGMDACILRGVSGNLAQVLSFEYFHSLLNEVHIFEHHLGIKSVICLVLSGLIATIIYAPLDLIMVRLYNQPLRQDGSGLLYHGVFDCLIKIVRRESWRSLWRGFTLSFLRLTPQTFVSYMFWDFIFIINFKRHSEIHSLTDVIQDILDLSDDEQNETDEKNIENADLNSATPIVKEDKDKIEEKKQPDDPKSVTPIVKEDKEKIEEKKQTDDLKSVTSKGEEDKEKIEEKKQTDDPKSVTPKGKEDKEEKIEEKKQTDDPKSVTPKGKEDKEKIEEKKQTDDPKSVTPKGKEDNEKIEEKKQNDNPNFVKPILKEDKDKTEEKKQYDDPNSIKPTVKSDKNEAKIEETNQNGDLDAPKIDKLIGEKENKNDTLKESENTKEITSGENIKKIEEDGNQNKENSTQENNLDNKETIK